MTGYTKERAERTELEVAVYSASVMELHEYIDRIGGRGGRIAGNPCRQVVGVSVPSSLWRNGTSGGNE